MEEIMSFKNVDQKHKYQVLVQHWLSINYVDRGGFTYQTGDVFEQFCSWAKIEVYDRFSEQNFRAMLRALGVRVKDGMVFDLIHFDDWLRLPDPEFSDDDFRALEIVNALEGKRRVEAIKEATSIN
jgi:hypothetical protein